MTECPSCNTPNPEEARFCAQCGTRIATAGGTEIVGGDEAADAGLVGRTLSGRYNLRRRVGRGAMGTVFEAEHLRLQKRVAIKMLHANLQLDEDSMRRFQLEGVAAGRLQHPGVVQVFDFDRTEDGSFYLAMEYVDGTTLRERMKQGPMDPAVAVTLIRGVLDVLASAHAEGVVHRDLKPENVLVVEQESGNPQVKVLDFGISKLVDLHNEHTVLTHTGQILGTPMYMAPEQWSGEEVTAQADLYATGAILFEMIAGEPLYRGRNLTELLSQHTQHDVPLLSERCAGREIPRDLDEALEKALAKDPARRFSDAQEMNAALSTIDWGRLAGRGIVARAERFVRKRPKETAALAVLVLAAGAALPFLLGGDADDGAAASGGPTSPVASGPDADATKKPITSTPSAASSGLRLGRRDPETLTPAERIDVAQLGRARDSVERNDPRAALGALEELFDRPQPDAEAYLLRGRAYALLDDAETARRDLEQSLKLDEEYSEAHGELAALALQSGDVKSATEGFTRAVQLDDTNAAAHLGLAAIALLAGDAEGALRSATRAVALEPKNAQAHLACGRAHLHAGDHVSAESSLVEAKRIDASNAAIHLELARLYAARNELDQAEREWRETLSLDSRNVEAALELSASLLSQEKFLDARYVLQDMIARAPGTPQLYLSLALALDASGDPETAKLEMTRGLSRTSARSAAPYWTLYGTWLQESGQQDEAIEAYQSALLLDENVQARCNLAQIYLARYRIDEAREHLYFALEAESEHRDALYLLGVLEWEYEGDAPAALDAFVRYRDGGGRDPRVLDILDRNQK